MGFTPFQVATEQNFNSMPELPAQEPTIPSLKEWINQLKNMWSVVQNDLADARAAYKGQADKRRVEPKPFHIGDRIYLSTQFLQSLQLSKKLGPKYIGPFLIKRISNPVTVELELPKSLKVHPVIHCSLLKPKVILSLRLAPPPVPQPIKVERQQHFKIKAILDSRKHWGVTQYLVT